MPTSVRLIRPVVVLIAALLLAAPSMVAQVLIEVESPMPPPEWALLERELLRANDSAVEEFAASYMDERGYILHTPRWGTLDGTDDAFETFRNWTLLHALGASDPVLALYKKALEGHYRQYKEVVTTSTDVAKYGCYYKEFMPMSDFMHQGEGMQALLNQGLTDPNDVTLGQRLRRFAGFYMNEDPDALNYDPEKKIIRSFWTGSRGPMLRPATVYDWAGDHTEGRFHLLHHTGGTNKMMRYEEEYQGILDQFYSFPQSSAGDHPLNLIATQLALNAYSLDQEEKYRQWVIEYASAWRQRAADNGGNFPSNIGLDGSIGGAIDGRWYRGTYGWNFSFWHWQNRIEHENHVFWGIWPGMGNAYLLTGDRSYIDALRTQLDNVFAQQKTINGRLMIPHMYGMHIDRDEPRKHDVFDIVDGKHVIPEGQGVEGWYDWRPSLHTSEMIDLYLWSMDQKDLERIPKNGWVEFLKGENPGYPEQALRGELDHIRRRVESMRNDPTTPDTRLADWPLQLNPAATHELIRLMWGANLTGRMWTVHSRVRYFDPERRRAGVPPDVAALVTHIEEGGTKLTLVNVNHVEARTVIVQTGAFGEHQCQSVTVNGKSHPVNSRSFTVRLSPGAGAELTVTAKRYANRPTVRFPWGGK